LHSTRRPNSIRSDSSFGIAEDDRFLKDRASVSKLQGGDILGKWLSDNLKPCYISTSDAAFGRRVPELYPGFP
jgi:hypothetical protein